MSLPLGSQRRPVGLGWAGLPPPRPESVRVLIRGQSKTLSPSQPAALLMGAPGDCLKDFPLHLAHGRLQGPFAEWKLKVATRR